MDTRRELYRLLSELLDYPGDGISDRARHCRSMLEGVSPAAAQVMDSFVDLTEEVPPTQMEEVYTAAFDLSPQCSPYVGYQLVGEDPRRTVFMVRLRELYREAGFSEGNELPDHVAVMLRFLSVQSDESLENDLVKDALVPAMEKMAAALGTNAYGELMQAAAIYVGSRE